MEADHSHQVVDVIAVQPGRRRQQDEVMLALLQFVGAEDGWLRRIALGLWDELEVVRRDIEHAGGRAVLERDRHAAFAGD